MQNLNIVFFFYSGNSDDYLFIFRLSYLWSTPIGLFLTLIIGLTASFVVQKMSKIPPPVSDPRLFTPLIAARIKRRREQQQDQQQQQQGSTIGSQVFVLDTKDFNRVES